jgi:hypothetical protein
VPVPDAQFNGEVFRPLATHEIVVRALRRKELRLAGIANRQPVTVMLGEPTAGAVAAPSPTEPPPQVSTGGWGWQKWTGAGMTVVGVAGVAYTLISVFSYVGKESSLDADQKFVPACKGMNGTFTSCPTSNPSLSVDAANAAVAAYNANEQSAHDAKPLWIGFGVGGALLIAGGIVLFATAPSAASETPPPSAAVHVHVLPKVGVHDQGLSVIGTF